jgi:hypothetical protein
MKWMPEKALRAADRAADEGAKRGAERVLDEAQRIVPMDVGKLHDTGAVDAQDGEASVSYDTEYAAHLHEHPEFHFQRGREGKWLERATSDAAPTVLEDMAEGARSEL